MKTQEEMDRLVTLEMETLDYLNRQIKEIKERLDLLKEEVLFEETLDGKISILEEQAREDIEEIMKILRDKTGKDYQPFLHLLFLPRKHE